MPLFRLLRDMNVDYCRLPSWDCFLAHELCLLSGLLVYKTFCKGLYFLHIDPAAQVGRRRRGVCTKIRICKYCPLRTRNYFQPPRKKRFHAPDAPIYSSTLGRDKTRQDSDAPGLGRRRVFQILEEISGNGAIKCDIYIGQDVKMAGPQRNLQWDFVFFWPRPQTRPGSSVLGRSFCVWFLPYSISCLTRPQIRFFLAWRP